MKTTLLRRLTWMNINVSIPTCVCAQLCHISRTRPTTIRGCGTQSGSSNGRTTVRFNQCNITEAWALMFLHGPIERHVNDCECLRRSNKRAAQSGILLRRARDALLHCCIAAYAASRFFVQSAMFMDRSLVNCSADGLRPSIYTGAY